MGRICFIYSKKGKHNRGKTREIFFDFFLKRHILRLSGGVSCWHLPYHKKHVPSDVYDNMNFDVFSNFVDLEQAEKCACSRYRSSVSYVSFKVLWGHMLFWYGRCQQLTPPESVVLGDHFHNSEQHVIFTIMHFKQKTHGIKPWKTAFYKNLTGHHDAIP